MPQKIINKIISPFWFILVNFYSFFYASLFITDYSFFYKKGFSNIAGFTFLFLFQLLILWILDKKLPRELFLIKKLRQLAKLKDSSLLFCFFFLIVLSLSILGIARHLSFSSMSWDMGVFDQALWNTLQGNYLFSSLRGNINLMGDHFEPIIFLLVPFYALWPQVSTLIIFQAFLLALAVFPLYLIAKEKLENRFLIFAFIFSFTLSKAVRGIGLSDFHLEAFMPLLSFWGFYFLIKKKTLLFLISILLLLGCKETAVFMVAGFGLYTLFFLKQRSLGLSLIILSILAWVVETKLIIPFFSNNTGYFFYERLPFGQTYLENVQFIINNPLKFLGFLFMPEKTGFFLALLGSLGFLSVFSPAQYVLIILPLFPLFLGSQRLSGYYSLNSHYVAHVLPFVYIAAIYGAANLLKVARLNLGFIRRINIRVNGFYIGAFIVIMALFYHGKSDAYKFRKFFDSIKKYQSFQKFSYLSIIPQDVSVSATANLVPHLTHRRYTFEWGPENKLSLDTDYVVIDLNFLDYLPVESKSKVSAYFAAAEKKGYKKIFVNPEQTFFILFNPANDNSKVKNHRWAD